MLDTTAEMRRTPGAGARAFSREQISFNEILAAARRQARLAAVCVAAFVLLGLVYLVVAVPHYRATTSILIDSRRNQEQLMGSIAELTFDTGAIDSQLEVIASEKVAAGVVKALSLDTDEAFLKDGDGLTGPLKTLIGFALDPRKWFLSTEVADEDERQAARRKAIGKLVDNLVVKRIGRTYVLQISYTSPSAYQAMAIANAYADAYFAEQLDARYEVTRRASGWLQDRITELKENSLRTDLAVQRFKAEKGIASSGSGLVSDQQMAEVTTQLSIARGETARAEAKVQQMTDILKSGRADGAVTESLGNPVINELRSKYLRVSKLSAELMGRVGPRHFQVTSLQTEMQSYERLIFEELQRIADTYVSEVEVARSREASLAQAMAAQIGKQAVSNELMVSLRELEREADTFKSLYQIFLQRYQDALQRESFPTSEARVITAASRPERPSWPRPAIVLLLAGFLGAMAGAAAGAFREFQDRVFRIGAQVHQELGLNFIGMLPSVAAPATPEDGPSAMPPILRHVLDAPLSAFAETLRSAKVECDLAMGRTQRTQIIGIVSVLPNEGKTTVSKNFASLAAFLGARTLLLDCDLRNPSLTREIAPDATVGLLEVLKGDVSLEDAVRREEGSGLAFLPAVVRKRVTQSSELLGSRTMETFLAQAGETFDYIIVDLPPIGPVVDVRACGRLFDSFILVVEWGKTARSFVRNSLLDDKVLYEKCVGVLLNKVVAGEIALYDNIGSKSYYGARYGKYYGEGPKAAP